MKFLLAVFVGIPFMIFMGILAWDFTVQAWGSPFGKFMIIGMGLVMLGAFVKPFLGKRTYRRMAYVGDFLVGVVVGFKQAWREGWAK